MRATDEAADDQPAPDLESIVTARLLAAASVLLALVPAGEEVVKIAGPGYTVFIEPDEGEYD